MRPNHFKYLISATLILSASFLSINIHARAPLPESSLLSPIPVDERLTKGQLANGLNYYILPNSTPEKKVELRLIVKTGSLNERDDEQGLAHFMEHMAFNGTTNFPKHELVNQLEKMGVQFGADLNAYTGFNETVYILPIPTADPNNLAKGMQILEDWAFNATLADSDIEQERNVILEEWRASTQNPQARIQEQSLAVLTKDSLYAKRLPIGKTDIIEHAPPSTLRAFYKRWYRPNLMAVVMVGDVTVAQGKALIQQHFAKYNNPTEAITLPEVKLHNNPKPMIAVFEDKDLPSNTISWLQKERQDKMLTQTTADYIQVLKYTLLSQMLNSRFNELLDSAQPPFVSASAYIGSVAGIVRSKSALHLTADAAPEQQKSALTALQREVQRIVQHGFTQAELSRAKAQMLSLTLNQFNNRNKIESADKAAEYIRGETEGEYLPSLAWEASSQRAYLPYIELKDIDALARSYFTPDNRIVLVSSHDGDKALSLNDIEQILAQNSKVEAYAEKTKPTSLLNNLPKAGQIIATSYDKSLNLTTWTLSNGVKVSFKPTDFNQDEVQFIGHQAGGFSQLSDEVWRKTHWAFDALTEAGVNGLSKTQLSHLLADKIVKITLSSDETHQGVSGSFAPKDIETAMQMIYSLITGLNHNPDSFKGYLERAVAATANLSNDRMAAFQDTVERNLNRHNPRFHGAYPSATDWQATDYDLAYQSMRQAMDNANGMHFTFVGQINPKTLQRLSELYLGSLPSNLDATPSFKDNGYRPDFSKRTIEVAKGKEPLSLVHIAWGGETTYDRSERLALDAIGHIMTMRLTDQLREEQGGVYSIQAQGDVDRLPYAHFSFSIDFPCKPENSETLIQSALSVLQQLIDKGPTAQELEKFQKARAVGYREQLKNNSFWLNQLQATQKNGVSAQDILTYEQRLNALNVSDIQNTARKYLSSDGVTAVLKPE
ncbi:zinc protease [Hydromonas duriensis]|uniref:Zinc protease n=2 Tax=Hydromonas duriensis TaxID=1527608 RepID=A0A4R6YAG9_9BURK|nr:zinc protease [Hydromonas duriensis]